MDADLALTHEEELARLRQLRQRALPPDSAALIRALVERREAAEVRSAELRDAVDQLMEDIEADPGSQDFGARLEGLLELALEP